MPINPSPAAATLAPATLIDSDHPAAVGIPARMGFADVRNHLSTERMRRDMATDVFCWHGYTDIWLGGAWRKATPAFNLSLCERFGLLPLDCDGHSDSIHHPFDREGRRHMAYLAQRGSFDDVPLEAMRADFERHYPQWLAGMAQSAKVDFLSEVQAELQPDISSANRGKNRLPCRDNPAP